MNTQVEINSLTERELEVLKYIVQGYTNKQIAKLLIITHSTVKAHVSSILEKTKAKNRLEAAFIAEALGLFPNPHQDSKQP
jgi:DNA-binding NarL/FixJ family response regulator